MKSYRLLNMTQDEIEQLVTSDLDKYYSCAIKAMHNSNESEDNILHSIITQKIWSTANQLLSLASQKLDRKYTRSIQAALALHLQQLKEREKSWHKVFNPDLKYMKSKYEKEISFIRSILPNLSGMLEMTIPEEEIGFLSMFLGQTVDEHTPSRVGLIVVAHGRSTATSMADFANQLLSTDHIVGINAPINKSMPNVYGELCRAIEQCNQGKGVLLLVDMGSFATIQEDICTKTGIPCKVIPNVSSALVLEAGKVVISSDDSLDEIAEKVSERYRDYINTILPTKDNQLAYAQENQAVEELAKVRGAIITICSTGIGSAKKLGELIAEKVPAAKDLDILPLSILDDVKGIAKTLDKRLKLIVGNFNPEIESVPFFSIETVLMGDGIGKIEMLLRNFTDVYPNQKEKVYSREYAIRLIERQIKRFSPSFDTGAVMKQTIRIADRIGADMLEVAMPLDMTARIILHSASMLERVRVRDVVPMPSWGKEKISENKKMFNKLKAIVNEEFELFGLIAPDSELAYMLTNLINDPAYLSNKTKKVSIAGE